MLFHITSTLTTTITNILIRITAVLWCCTIVMQVITVVERHLAICHGFLHMVTSTVIWVKIIILGTILFSILFIQGFWLMTQCSGHFLIDHIVFTLEGDQCQINVNRVAATTFMTVTLVVTFTLDAMTYRKIKRMTVKLTRQSSFTKYQRESRQRCQDYVLTQAFVMPMTLLLQHGMFFLKSVDFVKYNNLIINFLFNICFTLVLYQIEA
ncbi:unnamed protein product [Bursaphelenchus okinawaensis]|uniref:7TM GPCR serpentine receptor class x (Srx) domain-containing protein n=1 Tax=Bursaphelenchus okinawaensis TaxID=465554 RepID=A0A811KE31_9BILA|nr:unnamed protein product [Bursaphelenchus okinawaensis]CAG9101490.1 unnamed protein product [Bursaphelenchus okinawaensis]